MGITRETQYVMECDVCDNSYITYAGDRRSAIGVFRENGWKIGKKHTCPDCSSNINKEKLE